jgi:WXG100 family type VII secretion target
MTQDLGGAAGTLSVATDRIAQAAGGVTDIAAALSSEIATMNDLLGQIRAGWQSSGAAPAFVTAMDAHLQDATALKDALSGHGSALRVTADQFAHADLELADAVAVVRR